MERHEHHFFIFFPRHQFGAKKERQPLKAMPVVFQISRAAQQELLVFPVLAAGCANLEPRDGWGAGVPGTFLAIAIETTTHLGIGDC